LTAGLNPIFVSRTPKEEFYFFEFFNVTVFIKD